MPLFQIRVQAYETRLRVLSGLIADELLKREAAARQTTAEELLRAEVQQKAAAVTPEEVQAAYENVKARFKDKPEAEVKKQIESGTEAAAARRAAPGVPEGAEGQGRRPGAARAAPARRGRGRRAVARDRRTRRSRSSSSPTSSARTASASRPTLKKLSETYGDRVRVVFRDIPAAHPPLRAEGRRGRGLRPRPGQVLGDARRAVRRPAASSRSPTSRLRGANRPGPPGLRQCLDSGKNEPRWKADKAAAEGYGVSGTPAFFINGRLVSGARPFETFAQIIDDELAAPRAPSRHAKMR